jgi:hypothetical protein
MSCFGLPSAPKLAIAFEPIVRFLTLMSHSHDVQRAWLEARHDEIGKALQDVDAAFGVSAPPSAAAQREASCALERS